MSSKYEGCIAKEIDGHFLKYYVAAACIRTGKQFVIVTF